jgi:hypothetical protein
MFTAKAAPKIAVFFLACAAAFSSTMLSTASAATSMDCHAVWKGKTLIKPGLCAPISVGSTDINFPTAINDHRLKGEPHPGHRLE